MNNIIKYKDINLNAIMNAENDTFNNKINSKLITELKSVFNEDEQKWYITNLYMYLNYHPTNDYPINLDNVWKMLDFANKGNAKRTLENNFTKDEDYKITVLPRENGKFSTEEITMNVDTFKNLCMISKTEKGKEIRKYYVKMENILNKVINEEHIEYVKQIENEKNKLIKEHDKNIIKEKALEKHNVLLNKFGTVGNIVYIIKVKSYENGNYIVKIGESRRGVYDRYNEHKNKYEECIVLDCFPVYRSKDFESLIHQYLNQYKVSNLKNHENEKELFLIGEELTYNQILQFINNNIKNYNDNNIEIEKINLEIEKINLEKLHIISNISESNIQNINKYINEYINESNNKELISKIDNLEKTNILFQKILNEINEKLNTLITKQKTTTNFNEPLPTLGPRLQKIHPETFKLIKVYDSVTECLKENYSMKRPSINKAVVENTVYNGYRWNLVDRMIDPDIVNIEPTKVTKIQKNGYIAKLNNDKTKIINIYLDRRTASTMNGYENAYLDLYVKNGKIVNNFYYKLLDDCDQELKQDFLNEKKINKILLYKNGFGQFNLQNELINEFACKYDCVNELNISDKSIKKSMDKKIPYNDCYYKYIGDKVVI